jgi:hypothetical protein
MVCIGLVGDELDATIDDAMRGEHAAPIGGASELRPLRARVSAILLTPPDLPALLAGKDREGLV